MTDEKTYRLEWLLDTPELRALSQDIEQTVRAFTQDYRKVLRADSAGKLDLIEFYVPDAAAPQENKPVMLEAVVGRKVFRAINDVPVTQSA